MRRTRLDRTLGRLVGIALLCGGPVTGLTEPALPEQPAPVRLSLSQTSPADFTAAGAAGASAAIARLTARAVFYSAQSEPGRLLVGLDYQFDRLDFDRIGLSDRELHAVYLSLTHVGERGRWHWLASVAPGVSAETDVIDEAGIYGRALLRAAWRAGPTLRWVGGLAFDHAFGEGSVYPVAGVDWRPSARLRVRGVLPRPRLEYAASEHLHWQVGLEPAGGRWRVRDQSGDGLVNLTTEGLRFEASLNWLVDRRWSLRFGLGRELDRRYELVDDSGRRIDDAVEDAAVASVSLAYRPE